MIGPRPAIGHMPFPGHRTQAEVREDEERRATNAYDQLAWCPREYRNLYRRLRQKGWPAYEARPLIEEHMALRSSVSVPVEAGPMIADQNRR